MAPDVQNPRIQLRTALHNTSKVSFVRYWFRSILSFLTMKRNIKREEKMIRLEHRLSYAQDDILCIHDNRLCAQDNMLCGDAMFNLSFFTNSVSILPIYHS